jgi:hypothetical protein
LVALALFNFCLANYTVLSEKALIVRDSITRASEYIRRLDELLDLLAAQGYNTTIVKQNIEDIMQILESARDNFRQGDIDKAKNDLEIGRTRFNQLVEQLNKLKNFVKVQKIEEFITKTDERITNLKEAISISSELSPTIKRASLTALNDAESSLERAKDFMEKTMYKEAVDELLNVKQKEEEALETLQSFTTIQSADNQY